MQYCFCMIFVFGVARIIIGMIVRRVSYFTFIVAITTLATVTACNQAAAGPLKNTDEADCCVGHSGLAHLQQNIECAEGLRHVLLAHGINIDDFKVVLAEDAQGNTLEICLVVDKDYKGQVSAKIFTVQSSHSTSPAPEANYIHPLAIAESYQPDLREEIAGKSLVLLE
jgi:hypothetical protein